MANNEKKVFKMNAQKEKADASTSAKNCKQHKIAYRKAVSLSSLKEQICELSLLLVAGNNQLGGWELLDQLLHQFYEGGFL